MCLRSRAHKFFGRRTYSSVYGMSLSMAMDVEAEIRDLKRRVGELEGSFGFLTQQVQGVHRDLLGFQQQTNRRVGKVDRGIEEFKEDGRGGKGGGGRRRRERTTTLARDTR